MKLHIPARLHDVVMDHARTYGWSGKNIMSARKFLDAHNLALLPKRMHQLPKDVNADLWRTPTERKANAKRREDRLAMRELAFHAAEGVSPTKSPEPPCWEIPGARERQKEEATQRRLASILKHMQSRQITASMAITERASPQIVNRIAGEPEIITKEN